MKHNTLGLIAAGIAAGCVAGTFGAGGGLLLVPMLGRFGNLEEDVLFPASVSIILPISLVTLLLSIPSDGINWMQALPLLIGSAVGGSVSVLLNGKVPTKWLHRLLGLFILYGGIRNLWIAFSG